MTNYICPKCGKKGNIEVNTCAVTDENVFEYDRHTCRDCGFIFYVESDTEYEGV